MTSRHRAYIARVRATVLAVALCGVAGGCSDGPHGSLVPNVPPRVELTSGPIDRSTDYYSVEFRWNAWDDDGQVDHFEYAIDSVTAGWTATTEHVATLLFTTPHPASDQTFTGEHTFYLRAMDDEGAASEIVERTFNARTVTPRTIPLRPTAYAEQRNGLNSPLLGGPAVRLMWDGEDPDGVTHEKPVAYRIMRVQTIGNLAGQWALARDAFRGADIDSIDVPGDSTEIVFKNLTASGANSYWMFWVRAIDEAGAIEQWPARRNAWPGYFFFYFSQSSLGGPVLSVSSPQFGAFESQGLNRAQSDFVFDRPMSFSWTADASESGADITGYRWGVDVLDPDDLRDPGWATGWSRSVTSVNGLRFTDRGAPKHTIIVQVRDSSGGLSTFTMTLTLVYFAFDRDVLLVDDELETSGTGLRPTDAEHQQFMRTVLGDALRALGRDPTIDVYSSFPDPTKFDNARPPSLSTFTRYRTIVWDAGAPPQFCTLYGLCAVSPTRAPAMANPLAFYLEAGGRFIVSGFAGARSTVLNIPPGVTSIGRAQGLGPGVRNFAYDYWGLPDLVQFTYQRASTNGLKSARPTAWASSRGYPALDFDTDRWFRFASTGWVNTEALATGRTPGLQPGDTMDSLYAFVSAAGFGGARGSDMHGLTNVQIFRRAAVSDDETWHYVTVYAGFPWYLMKQDQVTQTMTRLLDECLSDKRFAKQ